VIGSNQKQRARSLTGLFGCCCCGCFKGSSNRSWGVSCWWFGFDQRCGIGSFVQLVLGGGVGEKKVGGWVVKGRLGKWCGIGMGSSRSSSSRRSDKKKGAAKLLIGGST